MRREAAFGLALGSPVRWSSAVEMITRGEPSDFPRKDWQSDLRTRIARFADDIFSSHSARGGPRPSAGQISAPTEGHGAVVADSAAGVVPTERWWRPSAAIPSQRGRIASRGRAAVTRGAADQCDSTSTVCLSTHVLERHRHAGRPHAGASAQAEAPKDEAALKVAQAGMERAFGTRHHEMRHATTHNGMTATDVTTHRDMATADATAGTFEPIDVSHSGRGSVASGDANHMTGGQWSG